MRSWLLTNTFYAPAARRTGAGRSPVSNARPDDPPAFRFDHVSRRPAWEEAILDCTCLGGTDDGPPILFDLERPIGARPFQRLRISDARPARRSAILAIICPLYASAGRS